MKIEVIVNDVPSSQFDSLSELVKTQSDLLKLNIQLEQIEVIGLDPNATHPVVYFHSPSCSLDANGNEILQQTVKCEKRILIPVCNKDDDAKSLPVALSPLNAFLSDAYGEDWSAALFDVLISELWVGRATPRVFISYKRTDSERAANQLFDQFARYRIDTFLDECAIPRGADFQRELKFWLNDADLMCLLVTPNLCKSEWVRTEIEFAKSSQIGILPVLWPQVAEPSARKTDHYLQDLLDRLCHIPPIILGVDDVDPATGDLTQEVVRRIAGRALRERAYSLKTRLDQLLPIAREELSHLGEVSDAEHFGELRVRSERSQKLVRVVPYRPKLEQFHELHGANRRDEKPPVRTIGFYYLENDRSNRVAAGLNWAIEHKKKPECLLMSPDKTVD